MAKLYNKYINNLKDILYYDHYINFNYFMTLINNNKDDLITYKTYYDDRIPPLVEKIRNQRRLIGQNLINTLNNLDKLNSLLIRLHKTPQSTIKKARDCLHNIYINIYDLCAAIEDINININDYVCDRESLIYDIKSDRSRRYPLDDAKYNIILCNFLKPIF